jgi:hypothetical protein
MARPHNPDKIEAPIRSYQEEYIGERKEFERATEKFLRRLHKRHKLESVLANTVKVQRGRISVFR